MLSLNCHFGWHHPFKNALLNIKIIQKVTGYSTDSTFSCIQPPWFPPQKKHLSHTMGPSSTPAWQDILTSRFRCRTIFFPTSGDFTSQDLVGLYTPKNLPATALLSRWLNRLSVWWDIWYISSQEATPQKTKMTGWKISIFNRKYNFKWWIFQPVMLVFDSFAGV